MSGLLYSCIFLFVISQESSESANTTIEDEDVRGRKVQAQRIQTTCLLAKATPTHLIKRLFLRMLKTSAAFNVLTSLAHDIFRSGRTMFFNHV